MRRLPNRGRHHQAHGSDILQFRAGAAAGKNARGIARRAIQTPEPYSQPAESLNGAGIARLFVFFPQRQLPPHSLLFSKFINSASYHDVFGGDPVRFEQRDLGVAGATGSFSRNNFGKVDHVGPAALIVAVHLNQVAGFELRLLPGVGDDEVAAAYGFGVEFVLLRKIGADGVEVSSGREPPAFEDWIRGGGGGDDDVRIADGLFRRRHGGDRNFERGGHFGREGFTFLLVAAEGANGFDFSGAGDGFKLGARLQASTDNANALGVGAGEEFRGDAAGGAGAHLADVVGFDLGHQVTGLDAEKQDEEAQAVFGAGVDFQAHIAAGRVAGRHIVKVALAWDVQAGARMEDSRAVGEAFEGVFDGFEGERHGEDGFHIGFRKEKCHSWPRVGSRKSTQHTLAAKAAFTQLAFWRG